MRIAKYEYQHKIHSFYFFLVGVSNILFISLVENKKLFRFFPFEMGGEIVLSIQKMHITIKLSFIAIFKWYLYVSLL